MFTSFCQGTVAWQGEHRTEYIISTCVEPQQHQAPIQLSVLFEDSRTRSVMEAPPAYLSSWTVDNRHIPSYVWQPYTEPQIVAAYPPTVVGAFYPGCSSNDNDTTTWAPASGPQTCNALASRSTITNPFPFLACPPDSNGLSQVACPTSFSTVGDQGRYRDTLLHRYHPYQLSVQASVGHDVDPRTNWLDANANANVTARDMHEERCPPSGVFSSHPARTDRPPESGHVQKSWRRRQARNPTMSVSKETPLGGLGCHHAPRPPPQPPHLDEDPVQASRFHSKPFLSRSRIRRHYDEIERIYQCQWRGCDKAYGTLNHLNAHVAVKRHGDKRLPSGEARPRGRGVLIHLQSSRKCAWRGVSRKRREPTSLCSTDRRQIASAVFMLSNR